MISGCYTALITPFKDNGVDYVGLGTLIDFQIENNITGILAVGTTGESPTLSWEEHNRVIEDVAEKSKNRCLCIAGTGSNNTREAIAATQHAVDARVDAVLLVDPYYNGPSSLEIRKEYIEPVAEAFPDIQVIPYIIPGRTGTQLLPEDVALLCRKHKNINAVKEATGNIENMRRTRQCSGPDLTILSGDDAMIFDMMTDAKINASGVISVLSNIAPKALSELVDCIEKGEHEKAAKLRDALAPLFDLVTVTTMENTPYGQVVCKARNPLAVKTLMYILGMPSGGCRKPLGKMTENGVEKVLAAVKKVHKDHPEILKPVENFFKVNIEERIHTPSNWENLFYASYT
jgi:4-hydroxy-tetrahydrodipicolinate synthase